MKTMRNLTYHYGLKMRIYPSDKQKKIIKLNSGVFRATYNHLLGSEHEIFNLQRISKHADYYKLRKFLTHTYSINKRFAEYMIDKRLVSKKTIKQANAKNYKAYNDLTGWPIVDARIKQLKARIKTMKNLASHYIYMQDKCIDSLNAYNARKNLNASWHNYKLVHNAGMPRFHKKGYNEHYQTNAHYTRKSRMTVLDSTGVHFTNEAYNFIRLPKIGLVRVSGSQNRILKSKRDIRLGTVTVSMTQTGKYFVSMQLASDRPFVKEKPKTYTILGIDLNLDNFLTSSNGAMIGNPKFYRTQAKRLGKLQRIMSRRQRRAKKEHRKLNAAIDYQKESCNCRKHSRCRLA